MPAFRRACGRAADSLGKPQALAWGNCRGVSGGGNITQDRFSENGTRARAVGRSDTRYPTSDCSDVGTRRRTSGRLAGQPERAWLPTFQIARRLVKGSDSRRADVSRFCERSGRLGLLPSGKRRRTWGPGEGLGRVLGLQAVPDSRVRRLACIVIGGGRAFQTFVNHAGPGC